MSTFFGDVLDLWGAARLISAAATRGDGLGMSTRLALVAGARRAELLKVRWPDLMWPDASGGCGTLLVACQNGGKTVVGALGYALSCGWPTASGCASAGSTRIGIGYRRPRQRHPYRRRDRHRRPPTGGPPRAGVC